MSYHSIEHDAVYMKAIESARAGVELLEEICGAVDILPPRLVTKAEILRLFGFTETGLRLVTEKLKWLEATTPNSGGREMYDARAVLRTVLLYRGLTNAPRARLDRKRNRISTVARELFRRGVSQSSHKKEQPDYSNTANPVGTLDGTVKSKRGRPAVEIVWPEVEFTVADLVRATGLSQPAINTKVSQALAIGKIQVIRAIRGRRGRPERVFRACSTNGSEIEVTA